VAEKTRMKRNANMQIKTCLNHHAVNSSSFPYFAQMFALCFSAPLKKHSAQNREERFLFPDL